MQNRIVEVSVILPSKDEEKSISICINKIRKVFDDNHIDGEIIVADNSQDETPIIAKELEADVITPDKHGYGYAYRYAFKHLKGKHGKYTKYIVMGDADNTYDFMEMPELLKPLIKGEADLIIGSRFKGRIEKGAMPWLHKWIGNPLLTWFLNLFFKAGVSDAHSGFRAITGEALEKLNLKADGMEFASEMIMEAARKGLRIKEVPISYYKRKNGNSKLSSFSDGWKHLKFMLMYAPTYLFTYPGLAFLLMGLFLMFSAFLSIRNGFAFGMHSMIAGSLLTIVGYQIVFFGFFANIYEQRGLPKFFTLEKGATIGVAMCILGLIYVLISLSRWIYSGFKLLPSLEQDILAFTFIVLGLQTFFSSFMLSITAERRK